MGSSLFSLGMVTHVESDPAKYRVVRNNGNPQIEQTEQPQPPEAFAEVAQCVKNFWNELRREGATSIVNRHLSHFKDRGVIPTVFVGNLLRLTEKMRNLSDLAAAPSEPSLNDYTALIFLLTNELAYQILHQKTPQPVTLCTYSDAIEPDVTLLVGDEKFPVKAHRSILAKSPFFKGMFAWNMREASAATIRLLDLDPDHVAAYITTLYTNSFPNHLGKVRHLSREEMEDVLLNEISLLQAIKGIARRFLNETVVEVCTARQRALQALSLRVFGKESYCPHEFEARKIDFPLQMPVCDGKLLLGDESVDVNLTFLKLHSPFFRKLIEVSTTNEIVLPKIGLPLQFYQKWADAIYLRSPGDTPQLGFDYSFYLKNCALVLLRIAKIEGDKILNERCCKQLIADFVEGENAALVDHFEVSLNSVEEGKKAFEYAARLPVIKTLRVEMKGEADCEPELVQLLQSKGKDLLEVEITGIKSDRVVEAIARYCPQLTVLKLAAKKPCNLSTLAEVLASCPNLRHLKVAGAFFMSDDADFSLPVTKLQHLEFGSGSMRSFIMLCIGQCPDLRSLTLRNLGILTNDLIDALYKAGMQFERLLLNSGVSVDPNLQPHLKQWLDLHSDYLDIKPKVGGGAAAVSDDVARAANARSARLGLAGVLAPAAPMPGVGLPIAYVGAPPAPPPALAPFPGPAPFPHPRSPVAIIGGGAQSVAADVAHAALVRSQRMGLDLSGSDPLSVPPTFALQPPAPPPPPPPPKAVAAIVPMIRGARGQSPAEAPFPAAASIDEGDQDRTEEKSILQQHRDDEPKEDEYPDVI